MKVEAVMKTRVFSIEESATLVDAICLMVEQGIGLLPVVNDERRIVGVIGLSDILRLSWPSFVDFVEDYDFVHDFGALESREVSIEQRQQPISELMMPPTAVDTNCGLLRAAAVMRQHRLRDLPVVDAQERLVGLVSWVDVGTAFFRDLCEIEYQS